MLWSIELDDTLGSIALVVDFDFDFGFVGLVFAVVAVEQRRCQRRREGLRWTAMSTWMILPLEVKAGLPCKSAVAVAAQSMCC